MNLSRRTFLFAPAMAALPLTASAAVTLERPWPVTQPGTLIAVVGNYRYRIEPDGWWVLLP